MYTGHVTVTEKDLIPLFTLIERLKMKGDIKKQLLINIRAQIETNNDALIQFLNQSDAVEATAIKEEIYAIIARKATANQLKQIGLHNLVLSAFQNLFVSLVTLCGADVQCPYHAVIEYLSHFTAKPVQQHQFATSALQKLARMKEFDFTKCSVAQCIEFVKLMDTLYREQAESVLFYKKCAAKIAANFNPFDCDECEALNGLLPKSFNALLVNAVHLQKSMIEVALLKYTELNEKIFPNQLQLFNFSTILKQRSEIYGDGNSFTMPKRNSSDHPTMRMRPPIIRTPPSPQKVYNECFSPRYRVGQKTTHQSLMDEVDNQSIYTPDILDAAIASVQNENYLKMSDEDQMNGIDAMIKNKYLKRMFKSFI